MNEPFRYLSGFANEHASEAVAGALQQRDHDACWQGLRRQFTGGHA
jgi:hypothetical protein